MEESVLTSILSDTSQLILECLTTIGLFYIFGLWLTLRGLNEVFSSSSSILFYFLDMTSDG
jgi:hypothetical protein